MSFFPDGMVVDMETVALFSKGATMKTLDNLRHLLSSRIYHTSYDLLPPARKALIDDDVSLIAQALKEKVNALDKGSKYCDCVSHDLSCLKEQAYDNALSDVNKAIDEMCGEQGIVKGGGE